MSTRPNHFEPPRRFPHQRFGGNIVLTDDNQNVPVRYDVFDAIRSETGTSDNSRQFTDKEYDSDVRLYYYAEN